MSKIAGALNMLPKTILDEIITNDSTNEAIKIYQSLLLFVLYVTAEGLAKIIIVRDICFR
jgi:hypothetical protein